jgi:hypothetical protein
MRRLRYGSPGVLGREYTSLSADCGPDKSKINKEEIEMRSGKINGQ